MNEFNNRMNLQRQVLACVNKEAKSDEELCGLSDAAITRWASQNAISPKDRVLALLRRISDKLAFLACKSQEQITEDYKRLCAEVDGLIVELRQVIR